PQRSFSGAPRAAPTIGDSDWAPDHGLVGAAAAMPPHKMPIPSNNRAAFRNVQFTRRLKSPRSMGDPPVRPTIECSGRRVLTQLFSRDMFHPPAPSYGTA